jgi:chemotaxis protein MotB
MFEDDDEGGGGGSDAPWMATFADLMSLLLTFFILLLSFATMDIVKFRDALGSVQEAFGVTVKVEAQGDEAPTAAMTIFESPAAPSTVEDQALLQELSDAIEEERLTEQVDAAVDGRGVVLRISGEVLYLQGEAQLRPEAGPILSRVASLVASSNHRIVIEGHTDDVPIRTAQFPSNWELSTARAIAAMRFLVDHDIDASRVGVAGYADFRPLLANDTDEHRAITRRVEFVFIRNGTTG